MAHRAVIFDLGGVVVDSPLHAIARYEREHGIPEGLINRVVVGTGPGGAWSRLERGEIAMEVFFEAFDAECAAAGHAISTASLMEAISEGGPRPMMLEAIGRLRDHGLKTAALTNNWVTEGDGLAPLRSFFDVFVESAVVGLRKPDPRIYHHACTELGVPPEAAIFLDDIGRNLKTARELGMATIKVDDPEPALDELSGLIGIRLR
ncbi:MAG: HAD family phosphatase [Myxococcota bacterium]|nr:HAD family phosphatase [Myxococcota bacterium]